jgi:hypothetical protein
VGQGAARSLEQLADDDARQAQYPGRPDRRLLDLDR